MGHSCVQTQRKYVIARQHHHLIVCIDCRQLSEVNASQVGPSFALDAYSGNWRAAAFAQFGGKTLQQIQDKPENDPGPGESNFAHSQLYCSAHWHCNKDVDSAMHLAWNHKCAKPHLK